MGKHVIVGAGGVGGGVARELAAAGHQVVVVTRSGRAVEGAVGMRAVALDAGDAAALTAVTRGADALYNCANPSNYTKWAAEWPPLAASLLTAATDTGAGLVTMGNLYGYGEVDGPIRAGDPLAATGPLGRIRVRMWEDALEAQRAGRVRVTEARASDFVGPESGGQAHLGDHLFPRVLAGKKVWVFGAADVPHSWTYVPDVARTLATLGTDDRSWGRAWLVPSNAPLTQREAVASIAATAGVPMPKIGVVRRPALRAAGLVVPIARGFGEVLHQFERPFVVDASETTATFGIEPTPWPECIRTTLGAYSSAAPLAPLRN
jgi:nucleoside-diphosphate-sugar epimerase